MNRNTNGTRLVCNGSCDSLTDPPGSIGTELVTLSVIKFFDSLDKTVLEHIEKDIKAAEEELDDDAESIITNERYVYRNAYIKSYTNFNRNDNSTFNIYNYKIIS